MTVRSLTKTTIGLGAAFALMAGAIASATPANAQVRGEVRRAVGVQGDAGVHPEVGVQGEVQTQVRAEPATAGFAPAVSCSISLPPSGSFLEATYSQPNACGKCVAAGSAYEATGNYRAYCRNLRDGGTVVAVQLWLFCVVCRSGEPLASRAVMA